MTSLQVFSVFQADSAQWVKFKMAKQSGDLILLSQVISEAMNAIPMLLETLSTAPYQLVPIPARPHRLLQRGMSPQHLFVETLYDRFPKYFITDTSYSLKRIKKTVPQTGLSRRRRLLAQQNSLAYHPNKHRRMWEILCRPYSSKSTSPCNTPLILVDDVMTTGSTLAEAQRAVQVAHSQVVALLTLFVVQ